MPRPRDERQALEEEHAELPDQIAAFQRELDKKRLAEIEARLATMEPEQ